MTDSLIRIAKEFDAEAIALVHIRSWQKAYEQYIPESILSHLSVSERTQQWYSLLHEGVLILVLEKDNHLIGFASVCEFRDGNKGNLSGEISAIYLHPGYWRNGFGTKLCQAALTELSKAGYKEALLWVLEDNTPAQMFYENQGFQATSETKLEEFYDGGALLREVLYKKVL
ncbi:GNAT family N-acetyltransferase [Legionella worsleiensis]|uniref:Putative GCN5-related N-acetyltransferase n=1 Tax=Legionella worsleiensis TaxID=45076 RepID=A0A0W1AKS0_9GAMM|nr:GNAT family N-acetyltransferase [Legionella worsleiensis]KTD81870.1 putative GCN5-related N-acetyltransferase [Legionella worsleiensis]STY30931.1 Putative GCN5-related N-acetyltransferase [Legionella worsleiensis]